MHSIHIYGNLQVYLIGTIDDRISGEVDTSNVLKRHVRKNHAFPKNISVNANAHQFPTASSLAIVRNFSPQSSHDHQHSQPVTLNLLNDLSKDPDPAALVHPCHWTFPMLWWDPPRPCVETLGRLSTWKKRWKNGDIFKPSNHLGVSKNRGFSLQIINFNRVFHYKTIHFGGVPPIFWNTHLICFQNVPKPKSNLTIHPSDQSILGGWLNGR